MLDTLFLSFAKRARQVIAWVTFIFAAFGLAGMIAFCRTLIGGGGVTQAWEAAQIAEGLKALYTASICLFIASVVQLVRAKHNAQQTRLIESSEGDGSVWFQLPNMESINLSELSGEGLLTVLKAQVFEDKDLPRWIELRRVLGRKAFKDQHKAGRLYLMEQLKQFDTPPNQIEWKI